MLAISRLLLPSKLPVDKPGFQLNTNYQVGRVARLFAMSYVPSGLWSRLLVRIIGAMNTELVVQYLDGTSQSRLSREFILQDEGKKYTADR